ncbi:PAS domain-containing sensor histidine kinase [Bacteroides nordii]|jgi:PAS domain S-box-containing protein|uniref:PAS domain-containing sensor histidine kinase n=1 Tax=Bacteroides nordii TaxID=291645 RepID=UPI00189FE087|nr:ATP-binding protein [Bacteroides nordii]MCQ4914749.1 ATP-binding protein [Bacteroides nordii]
MANNLLLIPDNGPMNSYLWLFILLIILFIIIFYLLYRLHHLKKIVARNRDYRHFLSDILDNLPFPIMVKDIQNEFRYAYWNKESEVQSGIKREKAIGHNDYDIYGEERGRHYRNIDEELVRIGKPYRSEERYSTTDGVIHDTIVMKSILSWEALGKWLLVARWDVSQLKKYEREITAAKEELEEAIKKQSLALKSIDFGLIYIDKTYRVQWEETTHIKSLVPGRHYTPGLICYQTSALRDKPCEHCAFKEAIEQGVIVRHTIRIDKVDFEVTATPVYATGGKEVIGGLLRFEDITEKLKIEQDLREAKDKAEESNRLKSAFLANMSHEIRTPLNAIVGFSDMICQIDDPADKQEYMKIIIANNELLLQLIDDILDLSKIEAGTMDFSYSVTDINELMGNICHQMEQKDHSPEVQISFIEKAPACVINTDRVRLSQVMINLMSNAMKFTERGSISIGYRISEAKDEIYFFCKDTGMGIAADKLELVFERFVKLNAFVKGTGLGLAICRVIVERLGGTIGVDSKEGEGACFWFRIPVIFVS